MKAPDAVYDGRLAVDNREVAGVLERIADLLEFKDENPFKLRSYRVAAETIAEMQQPVAEIAARGAAALQELPGIGKSLSAQIIEIIETGTSSFFEELKEATPESVLELRRVSGIGLKTSQLLYQDFGIKSLDELKAFADGGGLDSVPGLGDKTAQRIKSSLNRLESERGKVRLNEATELAAAIVEQLRTVNAGSAPPMEVVGQVRRGCEMIDHVEVLASGEAKGLALAFAKFPQLAEIKAQRADRVEAATEKGVAVTLHLAPEADFAAAMVRATGSAEHLRDLEAEAEARGYAFKGFRLIEGKAPGSRKRKAKPAESAGRLQPRSEEEFYGALGLEFIAPELREGLGEVAAARDHQLPELIRVEDMRGDF
ncbi:MAG TPA: helix-hairpin-helix domain-containing protein, partial [Blastocatellia bacterium]